MKVVCEGCHTIYDIPEGGEGQIGCPYCEHVNRPGQAVRAISSVPQSRGNLPDHGKTMLGPMDGAMADETTAVRRAVSGKTLTLPEHGEAALVVLEGEGRGRRIALPKSEIILGRKEADVTLTDPEASRRHCTLLIYGDFAVVRDLGSANGTMVNNRLVKEGLLKPGGTVQIGATVFQFLLSSRSVPSSGSPDRGA
jgi:pSer/pThr/pTyr-binding forkhead associated (FHA) protein